MHTFTLNNLTLSCIIGIYAHERTSPQTLIFSVHAQLNQHEAALETQLALTIKTYCYNYKTRLLESMAHQLGHYILDKNPCILSLTLTIKKPAALKNAEYSYVRALLTRS